MQKHTFPRFALLFLSGALVLTSGCSGSSSSSSSSATNNTTTCVAGAANCQPISAQFGIPAANGAVYVNALFTSVTLCVPNASPANCQTISDVLVDTGSVGLRITSASLTLPINPETSGGLQVAECYPFQDGYTWGPVAQYTVSLGGSANNGEQVSSVPVQITSDSYFVTPGSCSSMGPSLNDPQSFGASGVLGIANIAGSAQYDCAGCQSAATISSYYTCSSSNACGANPTTMPLNLQVQNPVALFPIDNNGVIIELPDSIPSTGSPGVAGFLVFGIGTQSNNSLTASIVLGLDACGSFATVFDNVTYYSTCGSGSILDTGSNAIGFLDPSSPGVPNCVDSSGFYCFNDTFTVTNQGITNTTSDNVSFSVADADTLLSTSNAVFDNLAGENPGSFDFGLPFFFGRNVFVSYSSAGSTPSGYVAY